MKLSCINHEVRKQLGISSLSYILLDYYTIIRMAGGHPPSRADQARVLGFSESAIINAEKEISDLNLITEDESGYWTSDVFFKAQMGEIVKPTTTVDQVMELFNKVNGTKFSILTYASYIKYILTTAPDITLDHFEMVFEHKKEQWGKDDKMKGFNKPDTILRKGNFFRYLDEARHYYATK